MFGCIIVAELGFSENKKRSIFLIKKGESKMKKLVQLLVLVLVVSVFSIGYASTYNYENSGGTTETVKKTPDGGYERTTTYHNKGSGPVIYYYPGYVYGYGSVQAGYRYRYPRSGYSDSPVRVPSAPDVSRLLP